MGRVRVMRRAGLRSEIALTLAILLGASLLLGGFLFLRFSEQNLLEQRLQLAKMGTVLAAKVLAGHGQSLSDVHPDVLHHLQTGLDAQGWWLYNRELQLLSSFSDGAPTVSSAGDLRQLLLDQSEILEVTWPGLLSMPGNSGDSSALIAVPVRAASKVVGVLAVRYSLASLHLELVSAQRWLFLYTLAFGTVLAAAGLFLLNRNVVQPTRKLLQATRNVTSGDLAITLDSSGPKEIAELAESFNGMILALRASRQETELHINSLSETNATLKKTRNELIRSEKLATVGHLAAGMAHEIGNPLGALTGYLGLLQKDLAASPQADIITQASAEAERIDRLVRELLDYATPGMSFPEPVDPWQVVLDAVRLLELQGALKGCQLDYDAGLVLPAVSVDRDKLTQVMVNLLLNSRDACNGQGRITLLGFEKNSQVILRLTDDGCGIPENQLDAVFEPFFTTKAPGKGRGLGLAICQRIMAESGGAIRCESTPDQGSTFTLAFPKVEMNS